MPGASPQSQDASGWGSSNMGTSSRGHQERAPHFAQFLNPPASPPTQRVDGWSVPPSKGQQNTNRHSLSAFMAHTHPTSRGADAEGHGANLHSCRW